MTELARRRAFLGAAALVGTAALVPAFSSSRSEDGATSAAADRPAVLAAAGASGSGSRRRAPGGARPSERDPLPPARERARAFVRAFLRYQVGDGGERTRAALARTASAPLTRDLVGRPAGSVANAPHAELVSLRVYARARSEVKASAHLRYGRRQRLFEFRLRHGRHGWQVAELYP